MRERARLKVASKFTWDSIARKFQDDILMAGGAADQGASLQAMRAADFNR